MNYVQWISRNVENGTRTVLKNPWLLFSLMAVSFTARMLFARPNREKS